MSPLMVAGRYSTSGTLVSIGVYVSVLSPLRGCVWSAGARAAGVSRGHQRSPEVSQRSAGMSPMDASRDPGKECAQWVGLRPTDSDEKLARWDPD